MHDDATRAQIEAAHPARSTWLSANAGSGKTRVLTDRVARLLLHGVQPQNILCLTYTKAAASEMQNRLFARLGEWAMLEDDALRARLATLGEDLREEGPKLDHARTLFARAIETPGGLRIQTIHAFCAALLRRFPLEAGISPLFRELDDDAARLLREEALDRMAEGPHGDLVGRMAMFPKFAADPAKVLSEISGKREAFEALPSEEAIMRAFGLAPGTTASDIAARCLQDGDDALIETWIELLRGGGKQDAQAAEALARIGTPKPDMETIRQLMAVFLNKTAPYAVKIARLPSKALREAHPALTERLHALMRRTERARAELNALFSAEQTLILLHFGHHFMKEYAAVKQQAGALDFDDLIEGALRLLEDDAQAEWIRYKLDGALDHILIDEAQDTSPEQWRLIDLLAQDLGTGEGTRPEDARSIFVVGDFKQSIFSFQGAAPQAFKDMGARFRERLAAIGDRLQDKALRHSFRSSSAILEFVDTVFAGDLMESLGERPAHLAFHDDMPGRVDLWPLVPKPEAPPRRAWHEPVDSTSPDNPDFRLARMLAGEIARMIETGSIPAKSEDFGQGFRPIRPGDFLILVQRRGPLFHEIIRACMAEGLPIAGADRMKLGNQLAVKDLVALLSFLALPQDDLALAAALRSPLFGLSEEALFEICHARPMPGLWDSLRQRREEFPQLVGTLESLLSATDFLLPYELLERVLTRHEGRKRLTARLGDEAEDGIDTLLALALQYERQEPASLAGFLNWLDVDETEVKRQLDDAGNRIRVMTVHGAKGLESPIVILPDIADRRPPDDGAFLETPDGMILAATARESETPLHQQAREAARAREEAERNRLLYVALTRAECWLIACGAGEAKAAGESWFEKLRRGMEALSTEPLPTPAGEGARFRKGRWEAASRESAPGEAAKSGPALPAWASAPPPRPESAPAPLIASQMEGPKALPGEGRGPLSAEDAMAHGTAVHRLLEHLPAFPPERHEEIAAQLLGDGPAAIRALEEARRVLAHPDLRAIFAPGGLSEVAVSARFRGRELRGTIDRLIVSQEKVMIVDFKTNRLIPPGPEEVPVGILRQMGVYCCAIEQIYPGRAVDLRILWTAGPGMMRLPRELALDSLVAATGLDREAAPS